MPLTTKHAPGNPFVDHAPGNPFVDAPGNPFVIDTGPSPTKAALAEGGRELADIALSVPQIAGDTLAAGASIPSFLKGLIPGGEGPVDAFKRQFTEEQQLFPASALRAINLPDANQLMAGAMSIPSLVPGGEGPDEAFDRNLASVDLQELQNEANFPLATKVSEFFADVVALLAAKRPIAGKIIGAERKLLGASPLEFGRAVKTIIAKPGFKELTKGALKSDGMKHLYRGAGRSIEAGVEATMLEIINGDNPAETAALAAGLQSAGSLSLFALKGRTGGSIGNIGLRIGAAAVAAGSLWQLVKNVIPGGDDRLIESMETGFEKVMLAVGLGLLSGVVGAGRLRGANTNLQKNLPIIMDSISTIHRGTFLGLLAAAKDGTPEQQAQIEQTLDVLTTKPDSIPAGVRQQLLTSMTDGTFVEAIDNLSANQEFQQALFASRPPALKSPLMDRPPGPF